LGKHISVHVVGRILADKVCLQGQSTLMSLGGNDNANRDTLQTNIKTRHGNIEFEMVYAECHHVQARPLCALFIAVGTPRGARASFDLASPQSTMT
jgi:hypothetical protein